MASFSMTRLAAAPDEYVWLIYYDTDADRGQAPAAERVARGGSAFLADNTGAQPLVRLGHELAGWSSAPNSATIDYVLGNYIQGVEQDMDFYPVWDNNRNRFYYYNVCYEDTGATAGAAPAAADYLRYSSVTIAANDHADPLMREDSLFLGWSEVAGGTSLADVLFTPGEQLSSLERDLRLYPVWDDGAPGGPVYQVSYLAGAEVQGAPPAPSEHPAGSDVILADNQGDPPLVWPGRHFLGWYETINGEPVGDYHAPGAVITAIDRDWLLLAAWDDNHGELYHVQVQYEVNLPAGYQGAPAGLWPAPEPVLYQGDWQEPAAPQVALPGYQFAGWSLDGTAAGQVNRLSGLTVDQSLYALWQPMPQVEVVFEAGAGRFPDDAAQLRLWVAYDDLLSEPSLPLRQGYLFRVWRDAAGQAWRFTEQRVRQDLQLYAEWQPLDDYNAGGGGSSGNGSGSGGGSGGGSSGNGAGGGTSNPDPAAESPAPEEAAPPPTVRLHARYLYGYADGSVRPDQALSRAEAATVFYRLSADLLPAAAQAPAVWYAPGLYYLNQLDLPPLANTYAAMISGAEFCRLAADYCELTGLTMPEDAQLGAREQVTRAQAVSYLNRLLGRNVAGNAVPAWANGYSDLPQDHWAYAAIMEASTDHYCTVNEAGWEEWLAI